MWLNKHGIANLLSIPQLEKDGYKVNYSSDREWVVTTPEGKDIKFKRGTDICHRMPYIDLQESQEGMAMLKIPYNNFEGFTERQVKDTILAHETQSMIAYPNDEEFKLMVSNKSL